MKIHLQNETAPLETVVLGRADQLGAVPPLEELYDPKSIAHWHAGTYPKEDDLCREMNAFKQVLEKYGVKVLHPSPIDQCNQIFTRDLGFVIDDTFVESNILPLRERELEGLQGLYADMDTDQWVKLDPEAHVEGGDVILFGDALFVGVCTRPDYSDIITARTNARAVTALQKVFPHKQVHAFELEKSTDPYKNALHLDCVFQPVGTHMAIVHPEGFTHQKACDFLCSHFKPQDIFEITAEEMYAMTSNVFSIAPDVVVSDPYFDRLNQWLTDRGITVEEVSYREVAKQEGLFRCSTLPIYRK